MSRYDNIVLSITCDILGPYCINLGYINVETAVFTFSMRTIVFQGHLKHHGI